MQILTLNNYGTIHIEKSDIGQVNTTKVGMVKKKEKSDSSHSSSENTRPEVKVAQTPEIKEGVLFCSDVQPHHATSTSDQKSMKSCDELMLQKVRRQGAYTPTKKTRDTTDMSLSSVAALLHSSTVNPSPNPEVYMNPVEKSGLGKYEQILKSWTSASRLHLVYDSSQQFFDSKGFNEKVCGRKNLLIVAVSGKSIFGSWHSKQVPKEKKDSFVYIKDDENHFVFTLKNEFNIPPTRFFPNEVGKHTKSLCLSGSKNTTCIVGVYSAFFIETVDDGSTVDWSFNTNYKDPTEKGHLIFTGKESFTTDRLLAFSV
ncbi:hypothetical protein EIN_386870 [Entamoeba invadens IP1]|uniref:TLDc domain-containing protein n=1 Tax=Entamoeba invadens IP1 TaxID=370355 RepID=A0A0A1UAB0_ENTIV|nr:hypothetical protein EIN_386870 [Entamoeba invadens IP1]ELP91993.1 hypothetical protein EIN_386870 [Entamoeba invadens IP1]|eukprot:XP_004258764.1 hypothetical protein EIN_386870 [Entamoeba invadens IP1]